MLKIYKQICEIEHFLSFKKRKLSNDKNFHVNLNFIEGKSFKKLYHVLLFI